MMTIKNNMKYEIINLKISDLIGYCTPEIVKVTSEKVTESE